jgi:hypothetical protein
MEAATPRSRAAALPAALAGMQSGMVGAICLVMWLGILAEWQQRNFWIPVNLMASAFYGPRAIRSGFASETISGLAVYLALYTILGAGFALVLRDRLSRPRTLLYAVVFALAWYYLSFRLLWKSAIPLAALLHVERSTTFGHLVYGVVLGGYPARLPRPAAPEPEPPPAADAPNETANEAPSGPLS